MLLRKTNIYNNINQRYVNHRKRIQNSYYLLIPVLAAHGGWPPADNFQAKIIFSEYFLIVAPEHYC